MVVAGLQGKAHLDAAEAMNVDEKEDGSAAQSSVDKTMQSFQAGMNLIRTVH
jgi:hypothetical protein